MNSLPEDSAKHVIPTALKQLWLRFLPEMSRRIECLEAAVVAMESHCCSPDLREQAHQAAHKLSGSLGMFGAVRGTEIARALEASLASTDEAANPEERKQWVAELRQIITE